jgi:hypothetical protein
MWGIWRAPNNASRWQMGFNSAFKRLNVFGEVKYFLATLEGDFKKINN